MEEQLTQTVLNISPQVFRSLATVAGFAAACVTVFALLGSKNDKPAGLLERLKTSLGLRALNTGFFLIGAAFWLVMLTSLFAGLIIVVWEVIWAIIPVTNDAVWDWRFSLITLTALTATLGAVVALPITLQRLRLTQLQTDTSAEGLITDRINKAVEGLGAEKTIKKQRTDKDGNPTYRKTDGEKNDYSQPVMTEVTAPNLEVRIGAIYSLERIAQDSERDHIQIMEILCSYIRNNTSLTDALHSPHEVFARLTEGKNDNQPLNAEEAYQDPEYHKANTIGVTPMDLSKETLEDWAGGLPSPRGDIQACVDVLGRRSNLELEREIAFKLDLTSTNLQSVHFRGNFNNATFKNSRMDNATFKGNLDGCSFIKTSLQNARGNVEFMRECDFSASNLSGASFIGIDLQRCRFWFSVLKWTCFNQATLRACDFFHSKPTGVYFHYVDASFSRFSSTNLDEFNGLNESESQGMWKNDETENRHLEESRFSSPENVTLSELEDRGQWLSYLKELGLTAAHHDRIN